MKSIQEWKDEKFKEDSGGMDPALLRRFMGGSTIDADPKLKQRMRSRIMDLVADYPNPKEALMAIMGSAISLLGDIPSRTISVSRAARAFDEPNRENGEREHEDF